VTTSHAFLIAASLILLAAMDAPRAENKPLVFAQSRSCQSVNTCKEAVEMWCGGYKRADADKDGIPCENVCRSLIQVEQIKAAIGC